MEDDLIARAKKVNEEFEENTLGRREPVIDELILALIDSRKFAARNIDYWQEAYWEMEEAYQTVSDDLHTLGLED